MLKFMQKEQYQDDSVTPTLAPTLEPMTDDACVNAEPDIADTLDTPETINGNEIPSDPNSKPDIIAPKPAGNPRCGGVALALGGGVARGWAHIGVLKAISEVGIPISMIAGTSIGALAGGCYLADTLDELEDFACSLTKSNMLRYMDFTFRASGLLAGDRLGAKLDQHMADLNIEDLPVPFVAIATDIRSGHEIWLHDGPMVPAVRASYALPGIFMPVLHNGRQLVDGAIVNPVPVSACRAYEPDLVIAVNLNAEIYGRGTVIRTSHHDVVQAPPDEGETQSSSWLSFLSSRTSKSAKQEQLGITAVMVESYNIIQDRISRTRLAGDPPDYTIRPKLRNIGLSEFHKAEEAIKLGYDEMMIRVRDLEAQGALATL